MTEPTQTVLDEIAAERARQNRKWGEQNHPDGTGPESMPMADYPYRDAYRAGRTLSVTSASVLARIATEQTDALATTGTVTWTEILLEEVFEALAEDDLARLRVELIQVAAVAAQWAESIDRRLMDEVHASRSSRHEARAAALKGEGIS